MTQTQPQYNWEWRGYGGVLTRISDSATLWMQGDDANNFDDEWQDCASVEDQNRLASAYDDVMDAD